MEPEENQEVEQEQVPTEESDTPLPADLIRPPKNPGVCPSVRKGEACWALSRGKPCHYAIHDESVTEMLAKNRSSNVYVCHLPLTTTKEQLEAIFTPFGEISAVDILTDPKTKENKGVAFVHFIKPEDAESAIAAIDGLVLTGEEKALECRMAKPTSKGRRDETEEDWECGDPTCAYLNWARRSSCNKCGAAKPKRRPPPRKGGGGYYRYEEDDYYGPPRPRGGPRGGAAPAEWDDYGPPRRQYYEDYYDDRRDYGPPGRYGPPPGRYGPPAGRYGPPPPARGGYGPPPPRGGGYEYDGPEAYESWGPGPERGAPPGPERGYGSYAPPPARGGRGGYGGPGAPY